MHRHTWRVESKVTQTSPWEQMNIRAPVTSVERVAPYFFEQAVIVTYRCATCGEQKVERV
jgi:formylmethanofuran dehydrogenase subunit E